VRQRRRHARGSGSLRTEHLDLENDRFRLNPDAVGLKSADEHPKWRDLLLSSATVRRYLPAEHPAPENLEAHVLVNQPRYGGLKPTTMLGVTAIGAIVGRFAERAAEDEPSIRGKPTHSHALRHNFVTLALRGDMFELIQRLYHPSAVGFVRRSGHPFQS
jgi:integrase